jgi:CRP/FNR family transcriptional regulator, cyclic AMP receptor protein
MASREPDRVLGRGQDRFSVVTIPREDRLFRRIAARQIRSVRAGGSSVRAARRDLRLRYPAAELNYQRDVLIRGTAVELWMAYRDGRARAAAPMVRWWDQRGTARITLDSDGRLRRPNAHCRNLLGLPAGTFPRLALQDLISAELHLEICRSAKWLSGYAETVGALQVRLPRGGRLTLEFCARPDATRNRFLLALRSSSERDHAIEREALRQSSLASLPSAVQRAVLGEGTRRILAPGERLTAMLTQESWVVLVVSGILRLYVTMDGLEPTLVYGSAGTLLGTHAMVAPKPLLVGLQAVTPSVLMQLRARQVERLAGSSSAFARAVSNEEHQQLHEVVRSFAARSSASLKQRLAREIVLLSDLQPDDAVVAVTEQQLADGVGSIRESVARTIADLRREGWIVTTRHGLIVLDKSTLRKAGQAGLN